MKRLLLITCCLSLLVSCSSPQDDGSFVAWRIAVSNEEIAQMLRPIVGERGLVLTLMPADADPETYISDEDDLSAIANAEIVFYDSGQEPWMEKLLAKSDQMEDEDVEIIMDEDITVPFVQMPRIDLQGTDYREELVRVLSEFDPEGASMYRGRGNRE